MNAVCRHSIQHCAQRGTGKGLAKNANIHDLSFLATQNNGFLIGTD
jgi:hypothetical protein